MSTTQQPVALQLAVSSSAMADEGEMIHLLSWHEIRNLLRADATELRRLHARIVELEAQLEAIAASAGSEPVAWLVCTEEGDPDMVFLSQHEAQQYLEDDERPTPLYTHPSPPEGMAGGWIALPGALPEPGVPVLLDIGKKYPIRAMWAAKHTLEVGMEDDAEFGEYDEATDTYYCPEGWYEWNEQEERHWFVDKTPVAWCELPTKTGTAQGQAPAQAAPAAVAGPTKTSSIFALRTEPEKGESEWAGIYSNRDDAEHDAEVMCSATGREWHVVTLAEASSATVPSTTTEAAVHEWQVSYTYGGEICANCGAVKGTRRGNATCGEAAAPTNQPAPPPSANSRRTANEQT